MNSRKFLANRFAMMFAWISGLFSSGKNRKIMESSKTSVKQYEGISSIRKNAEHIAGFFEGNSQNGFIFQTKHPMRRHKNMNHVRTKTKLRHKRIS